MRYVRLPSRALAENNSSPGSRFAVRQPSTAKNHKRSPSRMGPCASAAELD